MRSPPLILSSYQMTCTLPTSRFQPIKSLLFCLRVQLHGIPPSLKSLSSVPRYISTSSSSRVIACSTSPCTPVFPSPPLLQHVMPYHCRCITVLLDGRVERVSRRSVSHLFDRQAGRPAHILGTHHCTLHCTVPRSTHCSPLQWATWAEPCTGFSFLPRWV